MFNLNLSFQQPDPYDVFVLSYSSDVGILYKALEFNFSMIYKTTASYQPAIFPKIIHIISENL